MEGHERQDGGDVVKEREAPGHGERKRRDRDRDGSERPRRDGGEGEWRRERDREPRRGHHQHRRGSRNQESMNQGGNRPSSSYDSLASTDRKKKRIEEKEKEKQASTIFVGDLDPDTTAEQLTGLFCKFGRVVSSKIKENHCYGFVNFEKRVAAETAIAAGQNPDDIELINGKQVYVSWALGSLPEWKKGIGGFAVSPGKDLLHGHRSRNGVVKPSVLAAATAAAAAKANAVLASTDKTSTTEAMDEYRGRAIVAYDDLL